MATMGLLLYTRSFSHPRRQRADVGKGPVSPVVDSQSGFLDRPIWHFGLRRLWALYHLVSGGNRYYRGGPGDKGHVRWSSRWKFSLPVIRSSRIWRKSTCD